MMAVDGGCCLAAALMLLVLPLEWILSAFTAALVHECAHILALKSCGGRVRGFRVSLRGCVIHADPMPDAAAILSIAAGPVASLLLVLLRRKAPLLAVCGLMQGLFNLLPVLPLDGGRILQRILWRVMPERADAVMSALAMMLGGGLLMGAVLLYFSGKTAFWPLVLSVGFNIRLLVGKIPCKPPRIKVQ